MLVQQVPQRAWWRATNAGNNANQSTSNQSSRKRVLARIQAQKSARGYRALAEAVQISSPIVQTHSSQHESKAGRSTCPLATPLVGDPDRLVPLSLHHPEVKRGATKAVVNELMHGSSPVLICCRSCPVCVEAMHLCSAMPCVPVFLGGTLAPLPASKSDWHIHQYVRGRIPWHIHQT